MLVTKLSSKVLKKQTRLKNVNKPQCTKNRTNIKKIRKKRLHLRLKLVYHYRLIIRHCVCFLPSVHLTFSTIIYCKYFIYSTLLFVIFGLHCP